MEHNNEANHEGHRRGIQFPWKIHEMLKQAEEKGHTHIVSWLPDGKAFKVHKKEEFCNEIMPWWFNSNKYKTWQRSLNLWGFESVVRGPDKGACRHRAFLRGFPDFCKSMTRVKVKGSLLDAINRESASLPQSAGVPQIVSARTKPQNAAGLGPATSSTNKPAISDFLRSKAAPSPVDALLEAELLKRRLSAQLSNPLSAMALYQGNLSQSLLPQAGSGNWLHSQLLAAQFGGSMLRPSPPAPLNSADRLLSAINTAAAALNLIRQEEAEILRKSREENSASRS
jgi:hypothetical protein